MQKECKKAKRKEGSPRENWDLQLLGTAPPSALTLMSLSNNVHPHYFPRRSLTVTHAHTYTLTNRHCKYIEVYMNKHKTGHMLVAVLLYGHTSG